MSLNEKMHYREILPGCLLETHQLVEDKPLYNQLKRNIRLTLENGNLWTDRARFVAEQLAALDRRG